MAIVTLVASRTRSEVKTFSDTVLADLETAYNAYEAAKAADTDNSWTVRVVTSFWDGTNYILVAEAFHPEFNNSPGGTVPAGGGGE